MRDCGQNARKVANRPVIQIVITFMTDEEKISAQLVSKYWCCTMEKLLRGVSVHQPPLYMFLSKIQ